MTADGMLLLCKLMGQRCSTSERAVAAEALQRLQDRQASTQDYNEALQVATVAVLHEKTFISSTLLYTAYDQQHALIWSLLDALTLVHQLPPLLQDQWLQAARTCASLSELESLIARAATFKTAAAASTLGFSINTHPCFAAQGTVPAPASTTPPAAPAPPAALACFIDERTDGPQHCLQQDTCVLAAHEQVYDPILHQDAYLQQLASECPWSSTTVDITDSQTGALPFDVGGDTCSGHGSLSSSNSSKTVSSWCPLMADTVSEDNDDAAAAFDVCCSDLMPEDMGQAMHHNSSHSIILASNDMTDASQSVVFDAILQAMPTCSTWRQRATGHQQPSTHKHAPTTARQQH